MVEQTSQRPDRTKLIQSISNMFAGVRRERVRHIEIMTRALASVAIMEKGMFTAAFIK